MRTTSGCRKLLRGAFFPNLFGNIRADSFRWSWQADDLGLGPIPDESHCLRALIAEPETLVEEVVCVVIQRLQVRRGAEMKKLSLVEISELLRTFGIRALGEHGAPLWTLLIKVRRSR